ncbi:MAG: Peptide deformylase [uncultured Rubrobacteraceae bacterium]|uniref:Peptide deformylase n=1 Tax=uncultured Rubrobacteraceae bacterium TaxID=349277 RepID=A0A6J4QUK2_9ACTN|nr:MAG: Peptide deformylase [uncultured Rubrobacteraceae bacterium]
MEHDVRTFGDPVLTSRATPVKDFDESLERLAEDMVRIMREHDGVGLAANQIGRLKRIFVAAYEDEEYAIVNPVIETRSETTEKDIEGCLSIPGTRVEIERPLAVTVTGQDPSGAPVRVEAESLLARIFQHEIDHLDGILILDRTDRESRKEAMREIRERMLARK